MMSYWCSAFYPSYIITNGQYTRVTSFQHLFCPAGNRIATNSCGRALQHQQRLSYELGGNNTYYFGYCAHYRHCKSSLGAGQTVFWSLGSMLFPVQADRFYPPFILRYNKQWLYVEWIGDNIFQNQQTSLPATQNRFICLS